MKEHGFLKVAAAIPNLRVADCDFNVKRIKELLIRGVKENVQIICFPELSVTGYTCGDLFFQETLLKEAENAVQQLLEETRETDLQIAYVIGLPLKFHGKLYNVAIVCEDGYVSGIVPKSYLPNASEFYEKRWFNTLPSDEIEYIEFAGSRVPFGTNLLFGSERFCFAVEICEDLWATIPPSSRHATAGAKVIFNLSASNELVGKNQYRQSLICQQSARCIAGYVYAAAGWGESTTDLVFSGNGFIYENGSLLASSQRFAFDEQLVVSEIDVDRLSSERVKNTSFSNDDKGYQMISLEFPENIDAESLTRTINPLPFIPSDDKYSESCEEIFSIQTGGLAKRLQHTQIRHSIIGISGGLDSTLALLVCAKAYDKIGIHRNQIVGVTMPGFGTTDRTYTNAIQLMESLGVTIREIDIKAACEQHFKDIQHNPETHDITYENVQARERTQILMDIANQMNGLVIGTGDMSELALGWATYNGDHMSMYGVNSGIPKTLVRHLVSWVSETQLDDQASKILTDIIHTPVSPELLPAKNGIISQCTEAIVGPYELHDFFLYYTVRFGFSPAKIFYLAINAFKEKYPATNIINWMEVFFKRFFSQQFKRSCIPDGPKVGSINLSPRGDWRMPSDASSALWMKEVQNLKQSL